MTTFCFAFCQSNLSTEIARSLPTQFWNHIQRQMSSKTFHMNLWPGNAACLSACVAGSRHVNSLRGESLLYQTDCCTVQNVFLGAACSHVPARPAARQSFIFKWGAPGWGKQYMFIFDWSSLFNPQKATLDSLRTLSWYVSYRRLSHKFNFHCLLLL